MKICFICSEYPPGPHGGVGTLTQTLARGLVQAGHSVRVAGVYSKAYPAPDFEDDHGLLVWRFRERRHFLGWVRDRWDIFRTVARWAEIGAIDIVEVPDWEGWSAGWPQIPIPVIVRLSGSASYFSSEMGRRAPWSTYLLEDGAMHRADFWCSESNYVATKTRDLFSLSSGPDAIIYNPVEFPLHCGEFARRERMKVVFAGTLTRKKGVLSLIHAWPRVKQACVDAELHIWGKDERTGSGQTMLNVLLEELDESLRGSVFFHGHVPLAELLEVFQTARAAVFPSYAEGFALVPMHAMAAGCPTVYTVRGSGPELINPGQNGLLVDPDQPGEIADAIVQLLQDDAFAEKLGEAGRARIANTFALKSLIARNLGFYQDCLARFHRNGRMSTGSREPARCMESGVQQ